MYWMSKHSYLDICVTFADNFFTKLLTIISNKQKKRIKKFWYNDLFTNELIKMCKGSTVMHSDKNAL